MTIKHLLVGGGGIAGFLFYGATKELNKKKVWQLSHLESLHGISIGSWITIFILLDLPWEWIDDYFIKRPWEQVIGNFSTTDYITIIREKGLLDKNFFVEIFLPLFKTKDWSIDITFKELYEKTKINLHIYGSNINTNATIDKLDFCHTTYPDFKVIDAICISSAVPFLVKPIFIDNICGIDGSLITNITESCIKTYNIKNTDEILYIKYKDNDSVKENDISSIISNDTFILKYIYILVNKISFTLLNNISSNSINSINIMNNINSINNIIECNDPVIGSPDEWLTQFKDKKIRTFLIDAGIKIGYNFYNDNKIRLKFNNKESIDNTINNLEIDKQFADGIDINDTKTVDTLDINDTKTVDTLDINSDKTVDE